MLCLSVWVSIGETWLWVRRIHNPQKVSAYSLLATHWQVILMKGDKRTWLQLFFSLFLFIAPAWRSGTAQGAGRLMMLLLQIASIGGLSIGHSKANAPYSVSLSALCLRLAEIDKGKLETAKSAFLALVGPRILFLRSRYRSCLYISQAASAICKFELQVRRWLHWLLKLVHYFSCQAPSFAPPLIGKVFAEQSDER